MPYVVHNKFVVRGTLGTTDEIFSNTLHFTSDVSGDFDRVPDEWDAGDIEAALFAFYGSGHFSSAVHVTGWRGYQIGPNGRTVAGTKRVVDLASPTSGGGTHRYPPQVACVISLISDAEGPAQRGRIYLPIPNLATLGTTLEMVSGDADALLATFKTYIEALLDAMYTVSVAGEGLINASPSGDGVNAEVTLYKCGLALDTMRSRRNKLLENYQELPA